MKKLGDVCEIKTGKKDTKNKEDDGEYPFFVRSNTVERINSYSYDGEAILTSGDGVGVGKNFHYINGKFDFHQRVYSLRKFKNGYIGKYIYYLFSDRFYDRVTRLSAKNSVDSVRMDMISGMQVYFPLSTEQTKISSFLSLIDERIQTQIKIINDLKTLKIATAKKIFSGELRFKDDNGNDFPEWEVREVGEVFKITRGNVLAMNLVSNQCNEKNTYPVYSSQTKNNGLAGYYTDFLFEDAITWTTDGANAGDVNYRSGKFYCTNVCGVLISNEGYANSCIAELINSVSKNYVSYVGNPKLMNGVMSEIKIPFPSLPEQTKIANFLSAIDSKIDMENQLLQKLEEQKKYLLQNMFV